MIIAICIFSGLLGFCSIGIAFSVDWEKNYTSDEGAKACVIIFLAAALLFAGIPIATQHMTALSIPIKIAALERTIEQQTALISEDATLGQGLEGLEIKREIQSTIRELNDLIAKAEYIMISPWWMFKPDMGDS